MSDALSRQQICERTSRKLASAPTSAILATVGLDGFVDAICDVVDQRHGEDRYDRVKTIEAFRGKIAGAIGQSCNYELVVKRTKFGGNAPIMANALARLGASVTCIGNLGFPKIHPIFDDFATRARVITIGEPCHTDALEFDDGKLMLGKVTPLSDITWDNLIKHVGRELLQSLMGESQLIGLVNWTMLPHVNEIWTKLQTEMLHREANRRQTLFVDLADPEKRSLADLRDAMNLLSKFQPKIDVILGLNQKESQAVAKSLGTEATPRTIQQRLNVSCVVIHPRHGASAATSDGQVAEFDGPFVTQPKLSTGAGDHFNAGFALARVLEFDLEESLCVAVATSGYYVRTGETADARQLAEFIATLPAPE